MSVSFPGTEMVRRMSRTMAASLGLKQARAAETNHAEMLEVQQPRFHGDHTDESLR
jgi:hypothetical protein